MRTLPRTGQCPYFQPLPLLILLFDPPWAIQAEPYNKIVKPLSEMRDDTVQLIRKAVAQERRAYVLVNNRAEGCAPLTVQALVDILGTQ